MLLRLYVKKNMVTIVYEMNNKDFFAYEMIKKIYDYVKNYK